MTPRTATRLAWTLAALASTLLVSGLVIGDVELGLEVFIVLLATAFSVVGALVASRHPGNAIGWLFEGVGVAAGVGGLAGAYGQYWFDGGGGPRALGEAAAWYGNLSWIPFILVPSTFVLLLFPDGRLVSRRWRWVMWCAGAGMAGVFVVEGLSPGPIDDLPQLANPYGVESPLIEPLNGLAFLVVLVAIAGSCASLVVRFRHAEGERRQQIKWLSLAGVTAGVVIPVAVVGGLPVVPGGGRLWGETVTNVASTLSVLCLPLAAGVAILRHRLYDIDLVIRRTLIYGALTATLGLAYLGLVLLAGLAVGESDLAVAASTLAVAALFRPARARIQASVDRRFFRRRYDAALTLEAFGVRLRDEIDLQALGADLRGAAMETVQPAHVSLWLREPGR